MIIEKTDKQKQGYVGRRERNLVPTVRGERHATLMGYKDKDSQTRVYRQAAHSTLLEM